MAGSTLAFGNQIKCTEMGSLSGQMERSTKDSILRTRNTDTGLSSDQMADGMTEVGSMASRTDKAATAMQIIF